MDLPPLLAVPTSSDRVSSGHLPKDRFPALSFGQLLRKQSVVLKLPDMLLISPSGVWPINTPPPQGPSSRRWLESCESDLGPGLAET